MLQTVICQDGLSVVWFSRMACLKQAAALPVQHEQPPEAFLVLKYALGLQVVGAKEL